MNYTDQQRMEKILTISDKFSWYLKENNITGEEINNDFSVQWTITTPLYNIGEHVYYLSKELKSKYPEIPWTKISGLRHRLVHNYEGTNWDTVTAVIFNDLPVFIDQLRQIIKKS